jgi:hypothetical protein
MKKIFTILAFFPLLLRAQNVITLNPVLNGDSGPEIQAAINLEQATGGYVIHLNPGVFTIYESLVAANIVNGSYQQGYLNIEGASDAQDPISGQVTQILDESNSGFAIGVQQCKSCTIKNILFTGTYTFPNRLTELQVDTLQWSGWQDGVHSFNHSSPYTGIAIDPFSAPADYDGATNIMYPGMSQYYVAGMNRAGSTVITISGCMIQNFVVGICIDPAYQQNGEMVSINNNQIDYDAVCVAFSQAQSKVDFVNNLMVWGQVYTIFDGNNFGVYNGSGGYCPLIDGMNIAGFVHQFIYLTAETFPVIIRRIYAEGLFKFGTLNAKWGAHLDDCQFDFGMADSNVPSPGVFYVGNNTIFTNCMFRIYNSSTFLNRMPFFGSTLSFIGGAFGGPPVMGQINGYGKNAPFNPHFSGVLFTYYYNSGFTAQIDSFNSPYGEGAQLIRINRNNFTGYFTGYTGTSISPQDILITEMYTDDFIPVLVDDYTVGYVTSISGDTVYLSHMGTGIIDSTKYSLIDDRLVNVYAY